MTEQDGCIGEVIEINWMIVECDEGKLWIEHQPSFTAFEIDVNRPRENAIEIINELTAKAMSD